MTETVQIKVSATSVVNKVAGAIANCVREGKEVEVTAIGPKANNQAVKALATSRGFVASNGIDLLFKAAFSNVSVKEDDEDQERTAIKYIVVYK